MNNSKTITAKGVKIINILRNIHFILFNLVLIDGVFYSSRIIANIKFSEGVTVGTIEAQS
jgi:hypothetical protein